MLICIRFVDRVKVALFDFRWWSETAPVVTAEPGLGQARFAHPHCVIVLNGRPKHVLEPGLASGVLRQAIVYRQRHGGEEGRLRTREVIRAVGVQNLAIMSNLVNEIVHHGFCQIDAVIFQQPQCLEVAIPTVHFVKTPAWHHKRHSDVLTL